MPRHLFLTGEKGVGKSTLLRRLLADVPGPIGGFFTVKTEAVFPGWASVHLLRAGEEKSPGADDLLFFCDEPESVEPERFDRLGCAALSD